MVEIIQSSASQLQHENFDGIVVCPWHIVRHDNLAYIAGGIANPSALPDFARHHRGERIADTEIDVSGQINKLAGHFIWGGCYHEQFGHFIAEFAHRLWITAKKEYRDLPVIFTASKIDYKLQPFFTETLSFLGITNWKIITEPTKIEKLTIAEQGKHLNAPSKLHYLPFLEERSIAANLIYDDAPKNICILRGHRKGARLIGETQLENRLVSEGYVSFQPEKCPLETQLRTLANAEKIIISEGSALHLFDLLPKIKANVALINRRPSEVLSKATFTGKTSNINVFSDVVLAFIPKGKNGPDRNQALSFSPAEKILLFLKTNGFIDTEPTTHSIDYLEDLKQFLTLNAPHILSQNSDVDMGATNTLFSEIYDRSKTVRSLNIENTQLKAKLALYEQEFEKAEYLLNQCRWLSPDSEETRELLVLWKELSQES